MHPTKDPATFVSELSPRRDCEAETEIWAARVTSEMKRINDTNHSDLEEQRSAMTARAEGRASMKEILWADGCPVLAGETKHIVMQINLPFWCKDSDEL